MPDKIGLPSIAPEGMFFSLKPITYPEIIRKGEPFIVRGKVELFGIPFLAPIWVIAKVTAPETWWEHYIPIWGSPTVGEGQMAVGGDFEITFPRGFDREGEFSLEVEVHGGPTYTMDSITLPPFPPLASEKTTFIVAGEVPPEEVGFRNFRILSYSKNGGAPVIAPGVLELDVGDRCRVNVAFDHMNGAVTGEFHAAIWQTTLLDPHDEILNAEKAFSVPSSADWEPWEGYIDIIITSAISPGTEYGLYAKIMGITGGDIFTEYLANVITIVGVPEEYNGTINKKQLEYNETKGTIPVSNVPKGKRGLVHIWGRNDTSKNQTLGIGWVVTDPDGVVVERHEDDWAFGWVGAGQDREFIGGRFDLDKTGAYNIAIALYMNSGNPVEVDRYAGELCTIAAPALEPPEVETLGTEDITQTSATIRGRLIDTGYVSNVYFYFEFGKTTGYEMGSTEKHRTSDEGGIFEAGIAGLEADTRYHFRAVAEPITPYGEDIETAYGADESFLTEEAGLLEVYRTRYRYNGGSYDEPQVIYVGDEVGVQFNFRNVSGKTLSVYARLIFYSWGYSAGRIGTDWEGSMSPGETRAIHLEFIADVISEWTARLILEADGEEVLDTSIVIGKCPPF